MLRLIEQVFIILLSFSSSRAREANFTDQTKCASLNNGPCMVKPILIDLNPIELKYCPFEVSLDTCNGICKVLSPKTMKVLIKC